MKTHMTTRNAVASSFIAIVGLLVLALVVSGAAPVAEGPLVSFYSFSK